VYPHPSNSPLRNRPLKYSNGEPKIPKWGKAPAQIELGAF